MDKLASKFESETRKWQQRQAELEQDFVQRSNLNEEDYNAQKDVLLAKINELEAHQEQMEAQADQEREELMQAFDAEKEQLGKDTDQIQADFEGKLDEIMAEKAAVVEELDIIRSQLEQANSKTQKKRDKVRELKSLNLFDAGRIEELQEQMRLELTAKDKELEQHKESLQNNSNAQVAELEKCVVKMTEQRAKDKKEIETLKAAKKEQSLKMAKQAKENLMKQKELESHLKESSQTVTNLESYKSGLD